MGIQDSNTLIRSHLIVQAPLVALVSSRIYAAQPLPENYILPAVTFSSRGGTADPDVPSIVTVSCQFKCWADDPIEARQVYGALFDCLQGCEDYTGIVSVQQEVGGQDMEDPDVKGLYYVLTFFSFTIRSD